MRTLSAIRPELMQSFVGMRSAARHALFFVALLAGAMSMGTTAFGQPSLTVTNNGPNGEGNLEWVVEIAPDPTLFTMTDLGLGSSLAVELAFEIFHTDVIDVSVNSTDWPLDTSGNNPFTKTTTTGVDVDLANDTIYASLLSNFFTSANPVAVLAIVTDGTDCTSLQWGGHTVLGGTVDEYETSLIAQAGSSFTGYAGTIGVPAGDFDADCDVDGTDFLEWQEAYGSLYDGTDLANWASNYGTVGPLGAVISNVPEPTTFMLLLLSLPCTLRMRVAEQPSQTS